MAQLLLGRRAAVDAVANDKATPLHFACTSGHDSVAQLLLRSGATVDAT